MAAMGLPAARDGASVTIEALPVDSDTATPYDTWTGEYGDPITFECADACTIDLPAFQFDVALRLAPPAITRQL